ncbi:MAG: DnaJ domain-containing protein [Candidatus Dormibacteria bacterium]
MEVELTLAYRTLAISPTASDDEVKQAFRRLAWKYHPDLHPERTRNDDAFKILEAAYTAVRKARELARTSTPRTTNEPTVRLHPRMTLLSDIPEGVVVWCMDSALQVLESGLCSLKLDSRFWKAPRNGVRLAVLRTATGWEVATPDRWQMQWQTVRDCAPNAVPVERFVVGTLSPSGEDIVYQFVGRPEYDSRHPAVVPHWLIERGPARHVGS